MKVVTVSSMEHPLSKGAVTRGNFFLQLATQRRFKLPFSREIASCNTSSLQNNPTAGHTTTCIRLQFYRSLKYLFHPNLRSKLQEKIASCDSALRGQRKLITLTQERKVNSSVFMYNVSDHRDVTKRNTSY